MKVRIQAQHLQPGDIVGSNEKVTGIITNSVKFPSNKVMVSLAAYANSDHEGLRVRNVLWGKYTIINVERESGNS